MLTACQLGQRFLVFLNGILNDVIRNIGCRRLLVPFNGTDVILYILFVIAFLGPARRVSVLGPEPGRIRRENLIDENEFVVDQAKLKLGIRDERFEESAED